MSASPSLPEPIFEDIDGVRIATWVLEPSSGSRGDVVLCHGTPWSAEVWGDVARSLSNGYRVHLWDMPGYGRSEMSESAPVDLAAQAERLTTLVQRWRLRMPHVVAHDIGGAVALRAHLLHGVDFADLFLWDIVTLDPWGSPFFRLVAEHAEVFAQLPPALHRALVSAYISGSGVVRDDVDVLLTQPWADAAEQAAFYRQIAALSPDHTRPVAERLGSVRCPTRIGWGRDDPWIPLSQAYELQARLPGEPEVIVIDGVGHLAPLDAAAGVANAILDWLGERSAR